FRYYKKLKQDKEGKFNNRYGLLCESDIEKFKTFLVEHKLVQFSIVNKGQNSFVVLSKISSEQITELKTSIRSIKKNKAESLYEITQEIELIENITEHLRNLLDVYSGGYGLWKSNPIKKTIKLKNIDFPETKSKISFLFNKPQSNEDIDVIDENGIEQKGLE